MQVTIAPGSLTDAYIGQLDEEKHRRAAHQADRCSGSKP